LLSVLQNGYMRRSLENALFESLKAVEFGIFRRLKGQEK